MTAHARTLLVPVLCALMLGACARQGPDELVKSAYAALSKHDSKTAILQLKDALQQKPDSGEARYLLGRALLEAGEAQAASVELRKALDLRHPAATVVPTLAKSMLAEGQHRALVQQFAGVRLGASAADADLKTTLAIAHAAQAAPAEADAALAAALQAVPDYPPALTQQARRAAGDKRFDDALALIERVVAARPAEPEGWFHKGEFLAVGKADLAGAAAAFDKALAVKADFVPARAGLIGLRLTQRDLKGAAEQIELLRKLQPKSPQTTFFDAQLAFSSNEPKKAQALIQQVLKVVPQDAAVLQLAGNIQLANAALLEAERSYTQALALVPDLPAARRQLARVYLRLGQPGKALQVLEPLLVASESRTDKQTYALAGEAFLLAGDMDKAGTHYRAATALDPSAKNRTALAMTKLKAAGAQATVAELQQIAASEKDIYADLTLVGLLIRGRDFDAALKAVEAIAVKEPKSPTAANLRGRVLLHKGDRAGARQGFEAALAIDPRFVPAAASLAALDMEIKDFDAAKKRFESILAQDERNATALLAIAEIRTRAGAKKEEIEQLLAKAVKLNPDERGPRLTLINHHLNHQQNKIALGIAQEANTAFPNSPELLDSLGRAQAASGDHNQAISTFTTLALLLPQSADAQTRLAGAHLNARNTPAAKTALKRALTIAPGHVGAHRSLYELAIAERRPLEALEVGRSLKANRPELLAGYMLEASAEVARRNTAGAVKLYQVALQKFEATEPALKLHAMLVVGKRDGDAAELAKSWLAKHPKDVAFLLHLGEMSMGQRDLEAAEARFRSVLDLQPNNVAALNNIASIMAAANRPGALDFAQKANQLAPNSEILLDTLAAALAADKQVAKAIETQKAAIALAPADLMLKLNMAKLQLQAGDKAAARTELDALNRLGDKFVGQSEVKRLLQTL